MPATVRIKSSWRFEKYLKQVEFGNGAYHHYSTDKFVPEFSRGWFKQEVDALAKKEPAAMAFVGNDYADIERLVFDPLFLPNSKLLPQRL